VKYTDSITLLLKEQKVLQGMIGRLSEIGRCYGMEMNVEKSYGNKNLEATIPSTDYDKSKTT
jgi:hypothetical protein